ncbi:MAG TPA: TRAP transporter small permease subunit [bacterium]|nr:TRAP transporter small permease subunit [bacterium]
MKLLLKLNDAVGKVEAFFLCLFLFSMIVLAFLQVVMRDVFNAGLPWADTVVRTLVLWVGLLGAALATKLDQNLTLEVLTKYMPERARHAASAVVKAFAIVVCFFLLQATFKFLANERSTGEKFLHLFPSWYSLSIIEIAFVLIPFHLLVSIVKDVGYFLKGKTK